MKIGLIGWYGHENAGDERILYCLKRFFEGHEFFVTNSFDDALTKLKDLNRCDFVILGGGGLILRGYGIYASLINHIKPRFGCVGISIEAIHKDNIELIEALKKKAEFILVRDIKSRIILETHSKVIVGPDLTFLYPFEITNPVEADICGVNIRDWPYWTWELNSNSYNLIHKLNNYFPILKKIYPFPKWMPERAIEILKDNFYDLVPISLYNESLRKSDYELMRNYFDKVDDKFSSEVYKSCSYIVGMRLHSLIFACQMGIPFISLSYQPKNQEFCRSVGLEHLSVDLFDLSKLKPAISFMKDSKYELREKLLYYREKNKQEINNIMKRILKVITK
jgi:polysaccharide pyruvyl transferase WcaK-like protein